MAPDTSKPKAAKRVSTEQVAGRLTARERLTPKERQTLKRYTKSRPVKGAAGRISPATPEPLVARIFRKLGGQQELGADVFSEADLARVVDHGIRLSVLGHVERAGFSKQEIEHFIIPARTLRHRKTKREPLTLDESDRVVRLTRIQALAEDVFGDAARANRWLREGLGIFDGKSPLDVARTESGARVVEQILAKIDWGAAA